MCAHPLVRLANKVKKSGEDALGLPLQARSIRIDIDYEFGELRSGPKSEAQFRRLERNIEKAKLRFEAIQLKLDRHVGRIDAVISSLSDYPEPSSEERNFIADIRNWATDLTVSLSSQAEEIDSMLEETDMILATLALQVKD